MGGIHAKDSGSWRSTLFHWGRILLHALYKGFSQTRHLGCSNNQAAQAALFIKSWGLL